MSTQSQAAGAGGKPALPAVPEAIKARAYEPSGKCPVTAVLVMLGLLAMAIIAYIGTYASLWFLSGLSGSTAGSPSLLHSGLMLAMAVGCLACLAVAAGWLSWQIARLAACRSARWVGALGAVTGLCGAAARTGSLPLRPARGYDTAKRTADLPVQTEGSQAMGDKGEKSKKKAQKQKVAKKERQAKKKKEKKPESNP